MKAGGVSGLRKFARFLLWSTVLWFALSFASKGYAFLFYSSLVLGIILLYTDGRRVAKQPPPPTPATPTLLNNRYEVAKLLKTGGMAEITLATDYQTSSRVVIKTPRYDTQHDPKINVDKLTAEAAWLRQADHPHIVKFIDLFTHNGTLHLVVDYIEGQDLLKAFAGAPATENRVIKWAEQILSALAYIHGRGVVHRDLNPGNIMLRTKDDSVIIIDFGTVKPRAVHGGTVVTKPGFEVPEAALGYTDEKSDLFCIGGTLFYLLTSAPPGSIGKANVVNILVKKGVSQRTANSIDQALQLDAERRFRSALAMRKAICG